MCYQNYFDSSDSISSSETYVEETAQSESSGEAEATGGGVVRRPEVMEGSEALSANTTKGLYSRVSDTKRTEGQNKESLSITKKEIQG